MTNQTSFFVTLKNRGLVTVTGPDAAAFLQNLVTNDIALLEKQPSLYTCLLNAQGKFLHDFFITKNGDSYLLDCEGGERAQDLHKRLSMYKLRAQVELACQPENTVYAVFLAQHGWPDPRHSDLGWRSFEKPQGLEEKPFEEWDRLRLSLCIPDGSRDLIVNHSTMDEARMDRLNAVDYNKGCYVGQELTARMHYRGLGKKHLYTIQTSGAFPAFNTDLRAGDILIGDMRSSCGNIGLALLKDEFVDQIEKAGLKLLT